MSRLITPMASGNFAARLLTMSSLAGAMFAAYLWIGWHPAGTPSVLAMPEWVPFCPACLIPYFGLLAATCFLPAVIRDASHFRSCLKANLVAWLLVMPWWLILPGTLPRPAVPEGFWAGPFHALWAFDPPHNVMPCAHATGPVVAAWFAARDRPSWRWPLALTLGFSLPSIALVWQHRPMDILLGIAAAAAGIALVERPWMARH